MEQVFIAVPATTVDASGNAVVAQSQGKLSGFPLTMAKWNLAVQAQKGIVTVKSGSMVLAGPVPISNGGITLGPILSNPSDQISIQLSGGVVGDTFSGTIRGGGSNNLEELNAGIQAIGYSTLGSTQSDPSKLLAGQIGPPLSPDAFGNAIENQTYAVPGGGSHNLFVGQFDMNGYGAILLYGNCPNTVAGQALYVYLQWLDPFNNPIAYSQIDCLSPRFICFFGAMGTRVNLWIGNTSAGQVNVNQFTAIPFVTMPSDPGRYIPVAFGNIVSFAAVVFPTANVMVYSNGSVNAATTVNLVGTFVWYGAALWTVSPVTSGAGGINTWWAQLQVTDASGNVTFVDVITGQNVGGSNGPRAVFLPPGTPQVNFRNTGAAAINPIINLIAA